MLMIRMFAPVHHDSNDDDGGDDDDNVHNNLHQY